MISSKKVIGLFMYKSKLNPIFLNESYGRLECFVEGLEERIFEIDFSKLGDKIKIYYLKVYVVENIGIGSKALIYFEEWVLKNGFKKIIGELVNGKDSSSPDKLKYFYSKNHYEIEDTGDDYIYARISKYLI